MALTVKNLSYSYDKIPVLMDITFSAPEGKLTVLLGRNGSGKSTLLKIIAGTLAMQTGSIQVSGQDISALSGNKRASLIGYLPQFHQTVFPFSVKDVVLTGRAAHICSVPSSKDQQQAVQAMQTIGIEHLAERPYTELSGGERQMVMIARILAQNPKVILLDEPAAHLDLANQQRLFKIIKQITTNGVTVVAVLHDPNMAFLHSDNVYALKQGSIKEPSPGLNPWEPAFIEDIYGVRSESVPFRSKGLVVPVLE